MKDSMGLGEVRVVDFCNRYVPRWSRNEFQSQVRMTEGQLLRFLPQPAFRINNSFETVSKSIAVGFWAFDILFVTFCDRIGFISRLFSNKWAMFGLKVTLLAVPFYFQSKIQDMAAQVHYEGLYELVKTNYRKYKYTGDILTLNPQAHTYDISFPEI